MAGMKRYPLVVGNDVQLHFGSESGSIIEIGSSVVDFDYQKTVIT